MDTFDLSHPDILVGNEICHLVDKLASEKAITSTYECQKTLPPVRKNLYREESGKKLNEKLFLTLAASVEILKKTLYSSQLRNRAGSAAQPPRSNVARPPAKPPTHYIQFMEYFMAIGSIVKA
ncbi:hypothetical protein MSG28_013248 [Choristoneura fumiferana]|uniref:Uncharacterized protein n=1 Tax=Choristoneura fumiferana TaxID=7141 RepID=A0ACC0KSN0_CHOFU|nr:hypothetical protein MSG28_013248 [Choristoneura fumiferana]